MLISVVVPVYNSSRSLREIARRIDHLGQRMSPDRFEIIFVDDGSPNPQTWATLEELTGEYPEVRAFQLTRNFGQQAATLCGLSRARGTFIITIDDDLQHDPYEIPKLLKAKKHDVVVGQLTRVRHSPLRRLSSFIKGQFDSIIIGKPRGLRLSSFRLFHRFVVEGMLAIHAPNPFIPALMFSVTNNVVGVPVSHGPRFEGRSGYNFIRRVKMFSNLVINNSSLILRLVGYLGISFAALSFLVLTGVVYKKLAYGTAISGWTSLIGTLLLIGGLLLLSLGVVGEYLIRIIESSESKPTYFIRKSAAQALADEPIEEKPAERHPFC